MPYDEYRDAIIDSGVTVVETAGGNPQPHLPAFKAAGVKVVHRAVSVRHAIKAEQVGVDAVSIDGIECAGHPGNDGISGLVLIPAAAHALTIPVIASGGIATGAGLVAALALGASAVNMGTRFMATTEASIHHNVKQQIVHNTERDTVLVFRKFNNTARVARNSVSEEIAEISRKTDAEFADVAHLASGARAREQVYGRGDGEGGLWWASQAQGLIREVASCDEVVRGILAEARQIITHTLPNELHN